MIWLLRASNRRERALKCLAPLLAGKSAKERMVTAPEVVACVPDIIIGSWCGKKFRPEKVTARPHFDQTPAVQNDAVHEIKSPLILQPGPAALTAGLAKLERLIAAIARG
jgi:iron complex transport system substrate-binding protein